MSDQLDQNPKSKSVAMFPLILAIVLLGGVYIGKAISEKNGAGSSMVSASEENPSKLVNVINFIEKNYVDSVNKADIINEAIYDIMDELDPHSAYSTAAQSKSGREQLQGSFSGIGIEFMVLRDSLVVLDPIANGPSLRAGLKPGDRIVEVDGTAITGDTLTNDLVLTMLKGESGSDVKVKVKRKKEADLLNFVITRGSIPIESVVANYMVNSETGYIKVIRFARTTAFDFNKALRDLADKGAQQFIVDLRNNGGGYLPQAIALSEEFLKRNDLIVVTEGAHQKRIEDYARRTGEFSDFPVSILINESSASASEILAGAIQDHDRGSIIGRRSFGKGLVQREHPFEDESSIRLTIARYYTPSGRCIQKPYGEDVKYGSDYEARFDSGELFHRDSINISDTVKYFTAGNRVVYGGGGITPDIFIPLDTTYSIRLMNEVAYKGIIRQFAFDHADNNRKSLLDGYKDAVYFASQYSLSTSTWSEFLALMDDEEITFTAEEMATTESELKLRLKAQIGKYVFGDEALYRVINSTDTEINASLKNMRADLFSLQK